MKDVKAKPARGRGRKPAEAAVEAPAVPAPKAEAKVVAKAAPKAPARRAAPRPAAVKAPAPKPAELPLAPALQAPVPNLVETVVAPVAALDLAPPAAPSPEALAKPVAAVLEAGTAGARTFYAKAQETGATLRDAMTQSATATSRGLVELNGQMFALVRAQSDATFGFWRAALAATTVSEAIRVQTSGARQAYEASATHWKAIAETAGRTAEAALRPMFSGRG